MSSRKIYVPTGDLTIATATEFKAAVGDMISNGKFGALDLACVRRIDAAALQVMVVAERTGRIALKNPSQPVMKAMEAIGFIPTSVPSDGDSAGTHKTKKTARDRKRLQKRRTGGIEK